MRFIRNFYRDSTGGTAIEYGLILAMIVVVMFAGLSNFSNHTISLLGNVANDFSNAG